MVLLAADTSILGIVFLTPPNADSTTLDMSCGRTTPSIPCSSTIVPLPQSSNILPAISRLPPALPGGAGVLSAVGGICPLTGSTYTGVALSTPLVCGSAVGPAADGLSCAALSLSARSACRRAISACLS